MDSKEIPLSNLEARIQKQVSAAARALAQGNPNYTTGICMNILQKHPECLEIRQLLQKARLKAQSGAEKNSFTGIKNSISRLGFQMKQKKLLHRDPNAAMQAAEIRLNKNPSALEAWLLLSEAADIRGLSETRIYALQEAQNSAPDNDEITLKLGDAFLEAKKNARAIEEAEKVLKKNAMHGEAQMLLKNASVAVSIAQGKWEAGEVDYAQTNQLRDNLPEVSTTGSMQDEANIRGQIEELEKSVTANPENLQAYREMARAWKLLGNVAAAWDSVERARKTDAGKFDGSLERLSVSLKTDYYQDQAKDLQKALVQQPNNQELIKKTALLEQEEQIFRLQAYTSLVEKYPNDLDCHYELGMALWQTGQETEAARHFQIAIKSPRNRSNSLYYLGLLFARTKKYDLAVERLEEAARSLEEMNDQKKSVIYELAQCYEALGDSEMAFKYLKLLYGTDIGYRDVAAKLDQYYTQ